MGDHSSFERHFTELYREHGDAVRAYSMALVGRVDEAEDLVHDVFSSLWKRLPRLHEERSLRPYLIRSVRHLWIDRRRSLGERLRAMIRRSASDELPMPPFRSRTGAAAEANEVVLGLIDRLTPEQADVVLLKVFAELQWEEIGEVVRVPAATARSRYRTAMDVLRGHLERRLEHGRQGD